MEIFQNKYYHLYNRSNNNEIIFKEPDNYNYFLEKYNNYLRDHLDIFATEAYSNNTLKQNI